MTSSNSIDSKKTYYVSVTGIKIKSWYHMPKFIQHVRQSMKQAQEAPGNIHATGGYSQGVHHTITVWSNKAAMVRFVFSGYHKEAIAISQEVGVYVKTCGYHITGETPPLPSMKEARKQWEERGRLVFGQEEADNAVSTSASLLSPSAYFMVALISLGFLFCMHATVPAVHSILE